MTSKLSRVKDQGRGLPVTNHISTCLQHHQANEKFGYRVRLSFCKTLELPALAAWRPKAKHDISKLCKGRDRDFVPYALVSINPVNLLENIFFFFFTNGYDF